MLRSHLRTAFRNFRRNSAISLINLLGLSLGLATCLVAGLYIRHELAADQFHKDIDVIHRITAKFKEYNMNGSPYLFAEAAEKELPGVMSTLRMAGDESIVKLNNELYKHEIVFSDPAFFSFFTFTLEYGNPQKALSGLRQVVLGHEAAKKYFYNQNPVGKVIQIRLDGEYTDFEITGVAAEPPAYSSIHFDFLIPLDNKFVHNTETRDAWGAFFMATYLKVAPDKVAAINEAMPAFMMKHLPEHTRDGKPDMLFELNAFSRHHLGEGFESAGLHGGRSSKGLLVFGGIAIVILLLACFNFMNLTNAQSSRRAVEVGVRKVVGAGRAQLIRQFLSEALILSTFAALLALGFAELSLIVFKDIVDADLTVFSIGNIDVYAGLLLITIIAGLLAGTYPALVLANIQTLKTFKRYFKIGGSNYITRSVLALQFGLSIILIVCALVMWKQQNYMMNKDLGYNKDQLLVIPFANSDTASINFIKQEIKGLNEITSVSKTSGVFTRGSNVTIQTMPDGSRKFVYTLSVDEDFLSTMELKLVQGEGFSSSTPHDGSHIIVNETLLKEFNLEDSVGVRLGRTVGPAEHPIVVGVLRDFHNNALKYKIGATVIQLDREMWQSFLVARIEKGKMINAVEDIRKIWEKANTNTPFEYHFADDDVQKQYESETRWSSIITIGTGMAIFLSVLGLLGLSMFTAEQRKKEIGIRKVLGASLRQIVSLLSKDYMWLIAIAFIVSIPASYYVMTTYWLNSFEYRIEIDTMIYLVALIVVLLIAVLTIGSQTVRAALQNPADTLKEE